MAGLFSWLFEAIYNEYDRRIRAASEVSEYGAGHGHHVDEQHAAAASVAQTPTAHASHDEDSEDDDSAVEIVNVPRGSSIQGQANQDQASGEQTN